MYLKVTLDDGTVTMVGVSPSHTLRVIDPTDSTQAAWAVGGIKEVSIEEGDVVAAPVVPVAGSEADPAPPADAEPAQGPPADPPAAPAPPADPAHDDTVAAVSQQIADVAAAPADSPKQAASKQDALAALAADVDAALAQWPDSPQLADAKQQVEALQTPDPPAA